MNPLPSWVTRIRDDAMREAAATARVKLLARADELPADNLTTEEANAILAVISDAQRDMGHRESVSRRLRTQLNAVCGDVAALKDHAEQVRIRLLDLSRYSEFVLSSETKKAMIAVATEQKEG